MTSKESTNEVQDIWLCGNENIHMIQDLFEDIEKQERGSGRSTALAIKYAQIAIHAKNTPVIIQDHYDNENARRNVLMMVQNIFDTLKVEYEIGMIDKRIFVKVKPVKRRQW